jgi:hypothetical protein
MSLNLVTPNKDNKVVFVFGGLDLTLATNIVVNFGAETYQLSNPEVEVISATELQLDLSSTAEVGKIFATVTYFDSGSVNGTDITSRSLGNSDKIVVAVGTQLIIEDGSIVTGANSFVTDDEFKAYADIRNIDIPATQPDREALLVLAIDYLFSIEPELQGYRTDSTQSLPFPRIGVCLNQYPMDAHFIPQNVKNAQMELAIQAGQSDILVSEQSQSLASFSVDGVYSETYFNGGSWTQVRTDKADAYLNAMKKNNGAGNRLTRF